MDVISPADLWYSEEEEANFLASLGLGSISGVTSSSEDYSSTKLTDLWPKDSILMHKRVEIGDAAQYQFDDKGGDSHLISSSPSSSSIGSTLQGKELSIHQQDSYVTVDEDEDSWSVEEEQMLRAAMADCIFMHPVIPWQRIAEALPWRTPLEVYNRASQLLRTVQSQLSIFTTDQQQMFPEQQKQKQRKQQQEQRQRKRWSEEDHNKFLDGVEMYGWGNWKMVATLIPGRTVAQVTSHAQKCQNHNNPKRRRINNL